MNRPLTAVCGVGFGLVLVFGIGQPCEAQDETVLGNLTIQTAIKPKLILEQTGTVTGLPAKVWHVQGDDRSFVILSDVLAIGGGRRLAQPLSIGSGAPDGSLILAGIDGGGTGLPNTYRVGVGTFNPQRILHLSDGLRPTLRLQQDTSNFRPAQTYDIEGSESGFRLIDLGNVATPDPVLVPFTVEVDTPTDTLRLKSTGRVGMGTASPAARLHAVETAVSGAESVARFQVSDDTIGKLLISNATSANGAFIPKLQGTSASTVVALAMEAMITTDSGSAAAIFYNARKAAGGAVVTRPLVVYQNNGVTKVTIAANGQITANGVVLSSSRTLKDHIVNLDSRKAAEALRQLTPVEFVYKDDATAEKQVGFIAEDVPELVANKDRKSVPIMDVVAVLTRVVQDQDRQLREEQDRNARQQKLLDEQRAADAELRQTLAALNQRMTELEQQLRSVAAPAK